MIVDDERALVDLGEEILAKLGYEPVGFGSSAATQLTARALGSGVNEVLRKPLQSRELAEALARVLEIAHEST